ncbi:MAG TPA: right-handed parallel beta-helix repeat-containing protein [Pyrinomonadaceae bacterium]|nr:right-handed parallel beta-helix repeat-containing protein [Pyrinomonadaceae bacterium]
MSSFRRILYSRILLAFSLAALMLLLGVSLSTQSVSANHPVLVEGNCDSPVPGTTLVQFGTCGDYDGDGRIGTAEDTDGADRIFGTLRAALGPGTGAAAGTGANFNGTITIVRSGRFAESLFIGDQGIVPGEGSAAAGHVTIEAAPGVVANINAVLQGDAAGNFDRQNTYGIRISYLANNRRVVLRNLLISNFDVGVLITNDSRVTMDNCRFENNLNFGIRVRDTSRLAVFDSKVYATGFRLGSGTASTPSFGHGIYFENSAAGEVAHSHGTGNFGAALANAGSGLVTYYELFVGDNRQGPILGAVRNNTP